MPRPLILFIAFSLFTATVYGQEKPMPSPAVKAMLDQAVVEVKRNRQEFAKANEKPLGDAREELQGLFQKLVDSGKSADAQAVLKQIETLQADVLRMASDGSKPTMKPPVKTILEKAIRDVRKNREAFDKANQEPLGSARRQLQGLAKQQSDEGKTKEASTTLQQIDSLQSDVMRLAEAPAPVPPKPVPVNPPRPVLARDGEEVWNGHRYKVFKEALSWHDAKKKCEDLDGHLVIVNDEKENAVVAELLGRNGMPVDALRNGDWTGVWVGATDEAKEGVWQWIDGSPLGYVNWQIDPLKQPNGGPGAHYAAIQIHYGGTWDDRPTGDRFVVAFICEWDDAKLSGGSAPPQKPLLEGLEGKWDRPNQPDQWHLYANGTAEYRKDDGRLHMTGRISAVSDDTFEITWKNGWKCTCHVGVDVLRVLASFNPQGQQEGGEYALERIK